MNKIPIVSASVIFVFIIILVIFTPLLYFDKFSFSLLVQDKRFLQAIWFGVKTSTIATLFSAILGIPAGLLLSRKKNLFSKILDSFFELPVIMPPLIVGVLLLQLFNSNVIRELYNFIFTFSGAIIAQFFISFPFTVKFAKNSFDIISPVYEQIAMTLGATPLRSFYDTTLKLSYGGIFTGMLLSWIRCFGEFGATLLVGGGISQKTENLPIYIYLNISEGNFNKGITATLLMVCFGLLAIVLIKIILKQRYICK